MWWTNAYTAKDIGAHIASLRRAAGIGQAEFAQKLRVSRTTLSKLENGGSVSSALLVDALSWLGTRFVLVPRGAEVVVTKPESMRTEGS